MKVDLSLVVSVFAVALAIFAAIAAYLASIRLRGTEYNLDEKRVQLDKTREALDIDFRRMYDEIYREKGRWEEINHLVLDSLEKKPMDKIEAQMNATDAFLSSMGVSSDTKVEQNFVFVLTPLNEEEQGSYEVIRKTCQNVGLNVRRGDEVKILGPILPHILSEIKRAWLIIANINGRNPNVFYELGIAQALGKPCLLIASAGADVPFDLGQQQLILYGNQNELGERLSQAVSRLAIGGHLPAVQRSYFPNSIEQDMMIVLRDIDQVPRALEELGRMPGYIMASAAHGSPAIFVRGKSASKQFISDVSDYLKGLGVNTGAATLVSHAIEK